MGTRRRSNEGVGGGNICPKNNERVAVRPHLFCTVRVGISKRN